MENGNFIFFAFLIILKAAIFIKFMQLTRRDNLWVLLLNEQKFSHTFKTSLINKILIPKDYKSLTYKHDGNFLELKTFTSIMLQYETPSKTFQFVN